MKTCKTCKHYPTDCGYCQLNGRKDKGGNAITINFDMKHNCPDYKKS